MGSRNGCGIGLSSNTTLETIDVLLRSNGKRKVHDASQVDAKKISSKFLADEHSQCFLKFKSSDDSVGKVNSRICRESAKRSNGSNAATEWIGNARITERIRSDSECI